MTAIPIGSAQVTLDSWVDIVVAAQEGLLDERTHCELKKGLPPSSQNIEISRDIASLTVEGGLLLYGVSDAGSGRAGDVLGIDGADSAKTRLIAIADGLVQPSVVCDVRLVANADGGRACVLVIVPPSEMAPHRADQRYWGRSADGKRVLSDAEVAQLFSARRSASDQFLDQLRGLAQLDFNPLLAPRDPPSHGHLYLRAAPLQGNLRPPPWAANTHVLQLVSDARLRSGQYGGADFNALYHTEAHPAGLMASSRQTSEDFDEYDFVRLLIRDTGVIELVCGSGTFTFTSERQPSPIEVVPFSKLLLIVDQAVRLVSYVGRLRGEAGNYRLGIWVTRLSQKPAADFYYGHFFNKPQLFAESDYLKTVDASLATMVESPTQISEALLRGLARGLGLAGIYFPYQSAEDIFKRR